MKSFKQFLQERKYWGNEAAGTIIYCKGTNRILFIKRSGEEDSEQGQWEITVGGKKDDTDLDIVQTRDRESFEEIGSLPEVNRTRYLQIFMDTGDNHESFKYHTFVKEILSEFEPKLSEEHGDYKWIDIHNDVLPSPLHFGTIELLKHPSAERYFID